MPLNLDPESKIIDVLVQNGTSVDFDGTTFYNLSHWYEVNEDKAMIVHESVPKRVADSFPEFGVSKRSNIKVIDHLKEWVSLRPPQQLHRAVELKVALRTKDKSVSLVLVADDGDHYQIDIPESLLDEIARNARVYLLNRTNRVITEPKKEEPIKKNLTEEETLEAIYKDTQWHTWKCGCGCLNRRSSGNCGRCGVYASTEAMFYGINNYVNRLGREF